MNKIDKALKKLTTFEKKKIREVLLRLKNHKLENLDLKKLKGRNDVFRVRRGQIRIIYRVDSKGNIFILAVERRNDTTYNF